MANGGATPTPARRTPRRVPSVRSSVSANTNAELPPCPVYPCPVPREAVAVAVTWTERSQSGSASSSKESPNQAQMAVGVCGVWRGEGGVRLSISTLKSGTLSVRYRLSFSLVDRNGPRSTGGPIYSDLRSAPLCVTSVVLVQLCALLPAPPALMPMPALATRYPARALRLRHAPR